MVIKNMPHLLGSVGVKLPEPLFDTKLAGYLAHPDFHADTLEQAAAHFLDLHIEAQAESRDTGDAWTSTSLRKTIPENDRADTRPHRNRGAVGRISGRCAG